MTVTSSTGRNQYNGNGATTSFAYTFRILDQSHIKVILTSAAGVDTVQTITTNYTVSGVGNSGGGNITMLVAPATGERLTIIRNVPISQDSDYTEGAAFAAETFEGNLDKSIMIDQQLKEILARTVKAPESTTATEAQLTTFPTPTASNLIGWNASGTGLQNYSSSESSAAAAIAAAATAVAAAGIVRENRSSNTILSAADNRKYIRITSAFTQTFSACATLGANWNIWIENAATSDVTLDPNASETINGSTTFILRPGHVVQLQTDGTDIRVMGEQRSIGFNTLMSQIFS